MIRGRALWTDLAGLDTVVKRLVEPNERFTFRVIEIDSVGGGDWIVTLVDQSVLSMLESTGDFHLVPDAQEHRTCAFGQAADQVCPECREIQILLSDQRRHSGPAVGTGNGHAICVGFLDSGKRADRL